MSLPQAVRSKRKRLLADGFRDLLPREVIERRKQGFLVPIGPWLTSTLGGDVAAQLRDPPGALKPMFDSEAVKEVWGTFLASGEHWLRPWSLFALFTWWASTAATIPALP